MNVKLRKRHRLMWFVLGVGLPLLCLQALENIPQRPTAAIPIVSCPANIANCGITERHEISDHAINIEVVQKDSTSVITISYTQPIVSAFTLAYLSASEEVNDNVKLLGALNEMGAYSFEVPTAAMAGQNHILIYDKLNAETLYDHHLNQPNP